ncbi:MULTISPECIES: hypothetical protein [Nitrosomonas]|uniref:Uncharacterized protein n=1 Tax=Nitrosomonas communis TaxID=44574 RepID=A0A0F7KKJ9_9PROT|nr:MULTISPECIES: hypothetical protein [Nitrosomonas]AKH36573.1 hypothetical protein AAW31_00035 [Nitrosomonas communis]AKH39332.1 hypothetical protein AAW31_18370 [Nitrosomonas communis]TYP80615.1 hypothetical protein BCL69_10565 [Nitrosomonas communis]UVS61557.1 hypothetical protein NX761_19235 [Nitrosomonas sp. PLL12]UVS61580.1 hypothetical protein NX761_00030 [Nitrosomonas sp. PLL12]
MKQEILIPSTVISIISLSIGLFILSLDRMQSIEDIQAQNEKQIIENQLMTQQGWQTSRDHAHPTEASKKQEQLRKELHLRMKEHAMKYQLPNDRFRKGGVWM